ncbi:hypothetical protein [Gemmatimonas sp.]|uniref:hypothetical protein n=1 Tax=Gemmatimonas sp. TaxID=1962908 RepID=UPI00286B8D69|nr:hypothetical protein [Gemmatimonas sp.]
MLSKWQKDVRDGIIRGRAVKAPLPDPAREIAQLQALEQRYAELQEEHELLKTIRFCFIDAHCTQFRVIRYYNRSRLHSSLNYTSRIAFERCAA